VTSSDEASAPQAPAASREVSLRCTLRWGLSAHGRRLAYVGAVSLAIAVAARRPEFVAVAAPALVLLAASATHRPQAINATCRLSASRAYEGEQVAAEVEAQLEGADDQGAEISLLPPDNLPMAKRGPSQTAFSWPAVRWGRRAPGVAELALSCRAGTWESRAAVPLPPLAVYPRLGAVPRASPLGRLSSRSGDHAARSAGEGAEFMGVRQYAAGDRQRSVNWPASSRLGRLQVNTFAAERSQDVVLVVDASCQVGPVGATSFDKAVRGAMALARGHLEARDRVGLVIFGKRLLWVPVGAGKRQLARLLEGTLDAEPGWSGHEHVNRLPRAALPSGSSVVAFSALLDTQFIEVLRDLRQRGVPAVVVDVLDGEPGRGRTRLDRLGRRIWQMQREALIFSLGELGVPVVHWQGDEPLRLPLPPRSARQAARSRP
jgi:uncharacterized protein (DUF58 family)